MIYILMCGSSRGCGEHIAMSTNVGILVKNVKLMVINDSNVMGI